MKNFFIILVFACFLSSCTNSITVNSVSLNDQKDLTTIEMQERVKTDTVMYKVIEKDGGVYLVNPTTNLVEKQIKTELGPGDAIVVVCCIVAIIFLIFL